jgi:hypothetical protein
MWRCTVTVKDGEGHTSDVECNLPGATAYADAATMAEAFATRVLALTDGRIEQVAVTNTALALPAGNPAIGAGAGDVEAKGQWSFLATGSAGTFTYRITVPAIKNVMKLAGTDRLDPAQAAVTNFEAFMLTGDDVLIPTVGPVDSRAYDIVHLLSRKEAWGKKRKPLANAL